ncbi:MAG: hypothetical protein R2806_23265 [Saprospiraceae bacterium]
MNGKLKLRRNQTIASSVLWGSVYIICLLLIKNATLPKSTATWLAIVPVVFFFAFLFTIIREAAAMDEVQRRIQTEATITAFLLGLMFLMTLGMLDQVTPLNRDNWGYLSVVPFMGLFYAIGWLAARRKYHGE